MNDLGFTAPIEDAVLPSVARFRQSLKEPISAHGKGVHSGRACSVEICPAAPGTGIRFQRTDLPGAPIVPATYDFLAAEELDRRTTLKTPDASAHTIEHVLSALAGCGIDDALVKLDGPEPPIMDGSSLEFVRGITDANIITSDIPAEPIVIDRPLSFLYEQAEISVIPSPDFQVSFFYNSDHPNLQEQSYTTVINPEIYRTQIAPARTFCFFEEIEALYKAGLIKGASLACAVVIGRKGIINDSLRFPDEPVRHKILDLIGDIALLGRPIQGHILAWRAGHKVNAAFGMYLKKELNL